MFRELTCKQMVQPQVVDWPEVCLCAFSQNIVLGTKSPKRGRFVFGCAHIWWDHLMHTYQFI